MIEEAHARGLAVHAWVNAYLVWGCGGSYPVTGKSPGQYAHPDWLAVPRALGRQFYDQQPRTIRSTSSG